MVKWIYYLYVFWAAEYENNSKIHWLALVFEIADVIRVIYALPGHLYKYTTQSMTECPLKLSQHNTHDRTCGHHLQYDHFRTALHKNWRDLTGNSLNYYVTNTFSDDSWSRDFIVIWELRLPLRVLQSFENGDLIFSWKKKWNSRP
jgi:hypothetical protein